MSKLDKKIMSIFVVLILLASFIMPSISLAAEEEIVIKDSALKEALDKNKDGKVTKQEVEETRYISISKDVKNLDGLEHATNLESMDIEYVGQSYDFSKLNLDYVNLYLRVAGGVTNVDVSFLKTLKNVTYITFNENGTSEKVNINFAELKDISTLKDLSIYGDLLAPSNLDEIKQLSQIESLGIYGASDNVFPIDLKGISTMQNLNRVSLNGLKISNANELGKLKNLTNINIYGSEGLGDYSYLSNCAKLEYVSLSNLEEIDLSFLKDKNNMVYLYLYQSNLKNISAINTLKKLEYLSMYSNTLATEEDYKNINFADYTAYMGETSFINANINGYHANLEELFTFESNNSDIVSLENLENVASGKFTANKIGEATITATSIKYPSIKKTFKIKVTGISANQALGTEMGSSFIDGQTVLKANGELWRIYGNDAKAEKLATNVKKAVYNTIYGKDREGFPYALLLKNDGTLEFQFNGVSSTITDAKDIYQTGYLKKDGTYVTLLLDGTWDPVATNVEKIVGSYLVKTDGKTYSINNKLICDFPIIAASYEYVVDESGTIWNITDAKNPIKLRDGFDHFAAGDSYVDKDGTYRVIQSGKELEQKKRSEDLKLALDGKLYLGEKEILTNVVDFQYLIEYNTGALVRNVILREDGSIWTLTLDGEGALVKLEETENVYFKENTLKTKEVYGDSMNTKLALTGFDTNNLEVSKALANNNLQSGYTAKAYDGKEELKSNDKLFTGAIVKIYNKEGKVVNEYVALIYGDVTGTGIPSAKDALMIIKNKTGKLEIPTYLQLEAARVTENTRKTGGVPNSSDALAIIKAKLGKYTIEG